MKTSILNICALALGAAAVVSCDLDLFPNDGIAYNENGQLIQSEANLTSLENGILSSFRSYQNGKFYMTEEVMLDGFNATLDYGNNYGGVHQTNYTFTSSDYDVEDFWAYHYIGIKNYNIMIAACDNVPEALVAKARVAKGEAFFFRAASYLNLARHFGKAYSASTAATDLCVPLVLVYKQNEKPARATVKAVYDQIKTDLDSAAVLLASVPGAVRAQKPTIDAVNALYARYYLDIADYANAALYAHKVIDTDTYALASSEEEMTAEYVNDEGKEAIMQMFVSLTEFTGNAFDIWTIPTKDEKYGEIFRPYFIPSNTLVKAYEGTDLRLAAWFDNEVTVQLTGSYYTGDFYTFTKFRGNPALTSSPIRNARQAPKPFKIAEMYLIAAEAELNTDVAAAKADLNILQSKRGATSTEATIENVRNEWFKETVGEALRMSCLKRWGMGFSGRPAQPKAAIVLNSGEFFTDKVLAADSHYFQWPIPSHEMKVNKNLVQNDGYTD